MLKMKTNSVTVDGKSKMKPVEGYKNLSIGFFTSPSQAVIWRGPMAKALNQMILMLIGRTRLYVNRLTTRNWRYSPSIMQSLPVTGAVVSTPQASSCRC
jgi:ATP-binding protein involved in chromosome partitioning